ncbi:MAG: two-component sensor histidine kinase, partial [Desulfobacula sp.]|nr:two-component sensor histidine kinase [Desulfobacula sp.]
RTEGHSGLGLAITKKIIELHQQKISIATELKKGSCFSFSLPKTGSF